MIHLFDYTLSYKHILLIVAIVAMLVALAVCIYSIYNYLNRYSTLRKSVEKVYKRLSDNNKERSIERTKEIITSGNATDKTIMAKLDNLVTYSGINRYFPWINTETMLALVAVADALLIIAILIIEADLILAVSTVLISDTVLIVVLLYAGNLQYVKVEDALTQFMGCIENFSSVSNDLIDILDKSRRYIDPVLRPAVARCIIDANNSGNQTAALARLEDSFQHKYWKMCIRNLSICSKYSCNYTETINNMKEIIEEYISYEKERREEYRNTRIMLILMLVLGTYALYKIASIYDSTLLELFHTAGALNIVAAVIIVLDMYISIIKGMRH